MKRLRRKISISILALTMAMSVMMQNAISVFADEKVDAKIYMDTDQIITDDFEGFGVQWDPSDLYTYTDEQWASFVEKATFLKPNIMRVMLHDGDSYCIGFDENGKPQYDWNSPLMERTYRILDFAEENNIPIMLGEWRSISERGYLSYDEQGKQVSWANPTWAEMIVDCLEYLINEKGYTCIRYYNMINEPNYYKRDHPEKTDEYVYEQWRHAITNLRAEMDATDNQDITKIKIVGPDVYDRQEDWLNQSTRDDLKDKIELTEVHRYAPLSEVSSGEIERKLKRWKTLAEDLDPEVKNEGFGLGEMGLAGTGPGDCQLGVRNYDYGVNIFDYALQIARAGYKFGSVWGFEDSMHLQATDVVTTYKNDYGPEAKTEEGRQYQVHTPTGNPNIDNDIKIWGFWNELGEEMAAQNAANGVTGRPNTVQASDEKIRPWYYTWSMICRYFPSGMKILETTDSGVDQLRATSGILPVSKNQADISMAVVNSSSEERTMILNVPNAVGQTHLNQYFYYDGEINGKTRAVNEKGQLLPYGVLKDCDLSEGIQITLPAKSCMILTTLGYDGEQNPMTLTTGQTPSAEGIRIEESGQNQKLTVGKTYQMSSQLIPSIAKADTEWQVTDYFGNTSDIATIDEEGILTIQKAGQFKVTGNVKGHPEMSDTITLTATYSDILVEKFDSLDQDGVALSYQDVVKDGNPGNFGNTDTIKRSDSQPTGKPGVITYQADGIYDFEFKAFSLNDNLSTTQNFVVEASTDQLTWDNIPCTLTRGTKLSSDWFPYVVTDQGMDTTKDYQYLRITLKSQNGYKTYDPQFGGGVIYYGYQGASEVIINNQEKIIAKGQELQFHGAILPETISQTLKWRVVGTDGQPTAKAEMTASGKLTAHEIGRVVIIAEPEDQSLTTYYPIEIVGGYMQDDLDNFDHMYDHGEFVYEGAVDKFDDSTVIKRKDNTPQYLTYSYSQIQWGMMTVYSNNGLSKEKVDIYASQDGIHYDVLDVDIKTVSTEREFYKYEVSAVIENSDYHFIKFEVKNDEKIYCPIIGKTEIVYQALDDASIIGLNAKSPSLQMNVGDEMMMNLGIAPANSNAQLTYKSQDEAIVTVDNTGKLSAKSIGSAKIYIQASEDIQTECVVNVMNNMALKKTVESSSNENNTNVASNAVDGDMSTRWSSQYNDNQSLTLDLGEVKEIDTIKFFWESSRAKDYDIEIAGEDQQYTTLKELRNMTSQSLNDIITFDAVQARYIRMKGIHRINKYGYSLYELEVYHNGDLVNVQDIAFDNIENELYVGQTTQLNAQVTPANATYNIPVYSSSHPGVVLLQGDKMIALQSGDTTITAVADGKTTSFDVHVVEENAQKIADELKTLLIEDGQLVLPQHEGYLLSIVSSDHENMIDLDGQVHMPIYSKDVTVIIKVSKLNTKTKTLLEAYTTPITITLPGNPLALKPLEALIDDIHALDSTLYKPSLFKQLNDATQLIEKKLNRTDLLVKEVEKDYQSLNQYYQQLEYKEDRTTFNQLISQLQNLDSRLYTSISYQRVLQKITVLQTTISDDSSFDDIQKAIEELNDVQKRLVKQSDYDLLKDEITRFNSMDMTLYTTKSVNHLTQTLENAKKVLNDENVTTSKLHESYYAIQQAYAKLKLKGDKTSLVSLIEKIDKEDLSRYEKTGVENLKKVLQEAKEVIGLDLTQEEYTSLTQRLLIAYQNLNILEKESVQTGDIVNMIPIFSGLIIGLSGIVYFRKKKRLNK